MQPPSHRFLAPQGAFPADQNQKCRLKRIFGLLRAPKHSPANSEDHAGPCRRTTRNEKALSSRCTKNRSISFAIGAIRSFPDSTRLVDEPENVSK